MLIQIAKIIEKAEEILKIHKTSDPFILAEELGIEILERDFKKQLGVYMPVLDQPFIFIKADLEPELQKIVLLHEIGHHVLHRDITTQAQFFPEFSLFGVNNRMEYEANVFAAHISLPDDEFLEYLQIGYDINQIAQSMSTDTNLVALKVETLIQRGFKLNKQEYTSKFLIK